MPTVLVVDDQRQARKLLGAELAEAGFAVVEAADGNEGWRCFQRRRPDVVVTDLVMPRCDGLELLERIRSRSDVPVIVFSGHGSVESAAHAFKAGADDFVNSLELEIDDLVTLVREAASSAHAPPEKRDLESRLVGDGPAITRVRWQISGLAPLATPVLVSGERGSGKATAIRALHELGSTACGELVRIECSEFSPPGRAPDSRKLAAHGDGPPGAMHLAHVDRLSVEGQTYWLAHLAAAQKQGFRGDARLFASSTTPLAPLARSGRFHEGLARTLLRFHIEIPPLRERPEDLATLATFLLERIGRSVGRSRRRLSPAAIAHLKNCRFPENIRQLEQLLERATAYSRDRVIRRSTLEPLLADLEASIASMRDDREAIERVRLLETLRETGGNISHTAEILEKSRSSIYRLIEKHDIALTRRG